MKTEILFRGWSEARKEWIYGGICEYVADNPPHQRVSITMPVGPGIDVIPETVGQYTGLTDKNGVKIFEGDVVLSNTLSGKHWGEDLKEYTIGFYYGAYCFMIEGNPVRQWKDGTNDWYSIENNDTFTLKVTGNIHDK